MKDSDQHKKDISKLHKEKLGMDIPDNFFAKSKKNILNKIIQEEQPRQTIFWLRPIIAYPIAASIVLAITLTLWMQNKDTVNTEQITNTKTIKTINPDILNGDFLTSSLLISDSEMNTYLNSYLVTNVIIEAELSQQQLENIFINSVFIEDSLINNYLDKSLIENIVL
ncbi:hypothetical protein SAMN05421824_1234 [Hyunsoonleella jejuensis]|uniref:Uncharacterized protein n=1 Tax=Hyunsoonleella jejuensis TaxID=419940 RepID=A0A1H9DGV4_9FLAO|nr:hypothetical protein [Hyunsoonleella jejuensis]SEQ12722.1 hypothetical protein SAMN05421824_1234 [Hyunsoonleella jejuensis]